MRITVGGLVQGKLLKWTFDWGLLIVHIPMCWSCYNHCWRWSVGVTRTMAPSSVCVVVFCMEEEVVIREEWRLAVLFSVCIPAVPD